MIKSRQFAMRQHLIVVILFILAIETLSAQDFALRTNEAGLADAAQTNGVAVADYDLDGDLDVMFMGFLRYDPADESTWNKLYRNDGDGTFENVTEQANLKSGETVDRRDNMGHRFGAAWGDYNNDRYPDLFMTNSAGFNQLYMNNQDGTFTDVSEEAGILGGTHERHSSGLWWDFDLDGDLDLYVSAWYGAPNELYENNMDGTFTDITDLSGLGTIGWTWVSLPIDANYDGLSDVYVINDLGANEFFVNKGNMEFQEATAEYGLEDDGCGMGVTVGDYDNDGHFDIYLTNIASNRINPMFRNTGMGYFEHVSDELGVGDAGWAWGTKLFDCDHDGDLDLYVTNGYPLFEGENYFFVNRLGDGGSDFENTSVASNANGTADARGLVVFDYDNDGDLDMLVANTLENAYLYENQTASQNWLKIWLEGTTANADALGAVLEIKTVDGTYHRYHNGVEFLGQSLQPEHIGLGDAPMVDEIKIIWPNADIEKVEKIWVNQTIRIRQGEGIVESNLKTHSPVKTLELHGNYPNPFNGSTAVLFDIDEPGTASFSIYNPLGQRVYSSTQSFSNAGPNTFNWDGIDNQGNSVNSGLYLYTVTYHQSTASGKLLYIK